MNTKQFALDTLLKSNQLSKIVEVCHELLYSAPEAKKYLTYVNNRISKKSQKEFKFGYFPPFEQINLLKDRLPPSLLKDLRFLFEIDTNDQHNSVFGVNHFEHHNIVFPINDDLGNLVGLIGRSILSEQELIDKKLDKYKYSIFPKGEVLFCLNKAKDAILYSKKVILVEGQIDCISCYSQGFYNVVSLGGIDLSIYQFFLLKKYGGKDLQIYLLLDNDRAGDEGCDKILKKYGDMANFKRISIPEGFKDIDEYIKKTNDLSLLGGI